MSVCENGLNLRLSLGVFVKCKPQPPPSYFYSLSTFSFFKMRNYLDKVNKNLKVSFFFDHLFEMKSDDSLSRSHWIFKENLIFVWYCDGGGESHRLFTSLTLNNYAQGKGRSHLKTVDFHVCLIRFSLIYLIWIGLILRVRSLGQTAVLFCVSDVTSFTTQLCCSFSTFETTHFLQSFFSLLFILFLSCFFLLFLSVVYSRSRPEYNRVLQIRNITR